MQLNIINQNFQFHNEEESIESLLDKIKEMLEENNILLTHMVIDGVEVFTDFQDYIFKYLKDINLIEVKTKTIKEILDEMVITANEYLNRAIPDVRVLANEFYQAADDERWNRFLQLIEGVEWLLQFMSQIVDNKFIYKNWDKYMEIITRLESEMYNLEDAIKLEDSTLIADIVNYEFIPILELLQNEIKITIDNEGIGYVLS